MRNNRTLIKQLRLFFFKFIEETFRTFLPTFLHGIIIVN